MDVFFTNSSVFYHREYCVPYSSAFSKCMDTVSSGACRCFLWLGAVSLIPSPVLLGSGSLVFRQDFMEPEGYSLPLNLIVCALYLFVVFILYYRRTKNVDVL